MISPRLQDIIEKTRIVFRTQRGKDILVFLIFLGISAILWSVLTLNEEDQYDVRMPVRLTNVPDSVTVITTPPSASSGSLDYKVYRQRNHILLAETDIKALARAAFGGASILSVAPDTINLVFTMRRGVALPVNVDYKATSGPQSIISGRPTLSADTVLVYSTGRLPEHLNAISTEPIRLSDLGRSTTTRVRLIAPAHSRVIPDSVDVTFNVEPLIEPVNVPSDLKLITFPAQTEVLYMVPMSIYNTVDPRFRVQADYRSINLSSSSHRVKLRLRDVPASLHNVHLAADSVEYIIERR